ncbi:hypothetical protein BsWGS_12219 [Bradybaena similaris]
MSTSMCSIYGSPSVQRAVRINGIESARLQHRLGCIDQARTRHCRLTNQVIRLISTSMVSIQSSSGHSAEAKQYESKAHRDAQLQQTSPCFMYGERIWNRKRKRLQRPAAAYRYSTNTWSSDCLDFGSESSQERQIVHKHRPFSSADLGDVNFENNHGTPAGYEPGMGMDMCASGSSKLKERPTPRQPWEDDISEVTKKILSTQARAQSGKRQSVYQSHPEVMNSNTSRNVRDLLRKIRITATSAL